MRNQVLHGYLIHHRRYREKSHIVHLFSEEYGRIDGILRQNPPPQYQPLTLQATGKGDLKNFTKLEILNFPVFFQGDAFFAGFYLNEVLLRLCPLEEPMPETFRHYQHTLLQLQHLHQQQAPSHYLKQILRQFEHVLLQELGYAIDFEIDANQQPINSLAHYQFQSTEGFMPVLQHTQSTLSGQLIGCMQNYQIGNEFSPDQLQLLGKLYRQMITSLLGDRPLKSRQLWIQNTQSRS